MLADRRMLIVLDNARDADQIRPLLPGSPGCLVLVTSRSQLTPLIAAQDAHPLVLEPLTAGEARALLSQRLGERRVSAESEAPSAVTNRCLRLPLPPALLPPPPPPPPPPPLP